MERYLIDSNVLIDYFAGSFSNSAGLLIDSIINDNPIVSVITKIEILGFKNPLNIEKILTDFFEYSLVINLSTSIIDKTIVLKKNYRTKTADAIIAATAIIGDLTLLSRNTKDFSKIEQLKLINPWKL